ncbi:hypothetical protein BDA99DRAFT_535509 [Phascolomyces articulosus]|uniref:Uncharacterized protein n=1 Tax=Phascolomyces articulosus TaxID=60185 RepID=A0AAD5K3R5_9FUNG|nr:hypothetical protein BDA99DRAFT_535509 [Phascolomyces articulosus]
MSIDNNTTSEQIKAIKQKSLQWKQGILQLGQDRTQLANEVQELRQEFYDYFQRQREDTKRADQVDMACIERQLQGLLIHDNEVKGNNDTIAAPMDLQPLLQRLKNVEKRHNDIAARVNSIGQQVALLDKEATMLISAATP